MQILTRKSVTVVLAAVLIWLGYRALQIQDRAGQISSQVEDLAAKAEDLERDNRFLASSSAYFQSNAYLERQARLKLNFKLPDEQVAFVYKDNSIKAASNSHELQQTFWQKILERLRF
ncbi:MAG: hypothetical protein UX31_C0001G0048 [Candidatus Nomurabacteria bacterium GW2011_GWA1_46_11]|uniref:Cell division protein FtsL n=2 Tax=Parcubacteria group TaxID=1794811 RepID=A0A1F8EYX7_9BACT|nr:MAG: hypothetical protein UX31_C0001G0048 [Candidatus Nomurabacteria bacterium GW2011_GWA1_46_11]OGN06077.1 MAG: hypothetical protein A2669_00925 [Candidatus Yanofskybacteria bacterium RIFCSPHIGHO2_01_FULL_48_25b]